MSVSIARILGGQDPGTLVAHLATELPAPPWVLASFKEAAWTTYEPALLDIRSQYWNADFDVGTVIANATFNFNGPAPTAYVAAIYVTARVGNEEVLVEVLPTTLNNGDALDPGDTTYSFVLSAIE